MYRFFAWALVVVLASNPLGAEEGATFVLEANLALAMISKDHRIVVEVSDQVTDGCWLGAERTKASVERELIDAGFSDVVEEAFFANVINLTALGYGTTDAGCAVYVKFQLWVIDSVDRHFANHRFFDVRNRVVFEDASPLTGSKNGMTSRIQEEFEGSLDTLLVTIHREKIKLAREILASESVPEEAKAEILNAANR